MQRLGSISSPLRFFPNAEPPSAAEYLAASGYTMLVASRGSDALELAKQHTGLVFMSGYSNNLHASQQSVAPEHVFLQKPFRLTALARCIRDSLDVERQVGIRS